jgi:hypothetical protein
VAAVLAVLGVVAKVADARTPAFVRQTGLTCNQCHMSWSNAPDFTFTGMKFRINGFRTPWVAEKIEAGDEGAVNGQRLVLTLGSMLSWHTRSIIVGQNKAASDPSLPEPSRGAPTSQILSTIGMHYAGPIGEHVGIWNEFYMYGGALGPTPSSGGQGSGNRNGYIGLSHYDVIVSFNSGGNIYGFGGRMLPASGTHSFLGVTGNGVPNNQLRTPGILGGGSPYAFYGLHAFIADRVGLNIGVEPGESNLDYKKLNYRAEGGFFPLNTDAGWVCVGFQYKAGNDMNPGIATLTPLNDGVRTLVPAEFIKGVAATRASGKAYGSADMGDASRMLVSVGGGFTDKGPHSWVGTVGMSQESETFSDGGSSEMSAIGAESRYYYNRTYGVILGMNKYRKWNFTDPSGVLHNIGNDPALLVRLVYRLQMNFAFYWEFNSLQTYVLDQNWRNGSNWTLNMQYLW